LKVLHLIESLGSGGAERLLYTNLKHLDRDEVASDVVTVFDRDGYWKQPIKKLSVRVRSLNCSGYKDIPGGVARLRRVIAGSSPDLIHTHLFTANIIGRIAGRLSGVPVISSIHNPEYEAEAAAGASGSVRRKIAFARIVDKLTAWAGCARMIAVSRYIKESTVSRLGFPASKIDVVYNPVDIPAIIQEGKGREAVRESLGLSDDGFFLLNLGRLSPQKGFIDAVQAMPAILSSIPNARLISVGAQADVEYRSRVVELIDSLSLSDAVLLAGERRDVPDLLNACDVFVFPSHFEGLGIALAEAMVTGRACVTSDIAPMTEFVRHDVNGLLIPPGDLSSLAKAIVELAENPGRRDALGQAARKTALELFQPEAAAEKLTAIYLSTVK
jgi:glycosyltransferase involved in cell wall biosynthesis